MFDEKVTADLKSDTQFYIRTVSRHTPRAHLLRVPCIVVSAVLLCGAVWCVGQAQLSDRFTERQKMGRTNHESQVSMETQREGVAARRLR